VWSPSARFSTLALLAIVVPATIVAALGYVSIRQWEASSELAVSRAGARHGGDAQRVLSVRFRETLPDSRLAVYQASGAAPRLAIRRQVMLLTGAFGVLWSSSSRGSSQPGG
jgi:hypothetical protein